MRIQFEDEENHVNVLRSWLEKHKPAILNVAGSKTCDTRKVKEILKKAYKGVQYEIRHH